MSPKEKKESRSIRIAGLRLTKSEDAFFKAKALNSGITLAEFQRQSMIDCVIIQNDSEADKRLTYQLSSLGNNLNQITKRTNIHSELSLEDRERLSDLMTSINALLKDRL